MQTNSQDLLGKLIAALADNDHRAAGNACADIALLTHDTTQPLPNPYAEDGAVYRAQRSTLDTFQTHLRALLGVPSVGEFKELRHVVEIERAKGRRA